MKLSDDKWDDDQFFAMRKDVLAQWPTGADVTNIDEGVAFQRSLPPKQVLSSVIEQGRQAGKIVTMPQVGHATVEQTAEHMLRVEEHGGGDSWLIFMDTYTRKNRFADAQKMLEASIKEGKSKLNGYPCVCHGVAGVKKIRGISTAPFIITNVDEDPRLATEIAFAGGATGYLSYDLHDLLQHSKDYPLDKRIQNNQYGNRLIGYYSERGAPIVSWSSGHFTGWETPGVKIPIVILTALLSAKQGVKHIGVSLGLGVHLTQDVAALHVLRMLMREYLDRFGFHDVEVYLISYPFLGMWPADVERTSALVSLQASIGALAGVDWMIVKSLDEAFSIPRPEGNVAAMKIVKQILDVMSGQGLIDGDDLRIETEMIASEVRTVLDRTIELGDGQVSLGMMMAVEMGVLDGVFSPWIRCQNKVLTVRDNGGALRYFTAGNIPLPADVKDYNRAKIAEREAASGRKVDMETVIADIEFLARPVVPTENQDNALTPT